jgi:uncharacterized protein (DUF433 family)
MAQMDRIELDPRVCNGKAVIQGTRIPVSVILDQIASGYGGRPSFFQI